MSDRASRIGCAGVEYFEMPSAIASVVETSGALVRDHPVNRDRHA